MHQINIRSITCDSCCEPAVEYDNDTQCADDFNGKVFACKSCSALGRVDIDGEYNVARVSFILLGLNEVALVGDSTLIDAYWAGQKKIDSLYDEVSSLRQQLAEAKKVFRKVI
jgi:hypothetical protein